MLLLGAEISSSGKCSVRNSSSYWLALASSPPLPSAKLICWRTRAHDIFSCFAPQTCALVERKGNYICRRRASNYPQKLEGSFCPIMTNAFARKLSPETVYESTCCHSSLLLILFGAPIKGSECPPRGISQSITRPSRGTRGKTSKLSEARVSLTQRCRCNIYLTCGDIAGNFNRHHPAPIQ